jgi:hypothetical protein
VRYPYDRLLRFFVSRKVDVNQALERYGLPSVGDIWVANARTRIRDEAPYALAKYIDSDESELSAKDGVLDWAEGEGFLELWKIQKEFGGGPPPPALDLAFRIFMNPHSRSTMGLLLLSRATSEDISDICKERYDVLVSEEVLEVYQRLFWDTKSMGRKEWNRFIPTLLTKQERSDLAVGLDSPTMEDVRDIVGVDAVIDPEYIVSQIATRSYLQWKRAMDEPCPEGAGVKMWMEAALKAADQLHKMRPKAIDSENALPAEGFQGLFSVQISKTEHPTLAELQGEVATPAPPKTGEEGA